LLYRSDTTLTFYLGVSTLYSLKAPKSKFGTVCANGDRGGGLEAVASLRLVLPNAVTDGVTLFTTKEIITFFSHCPSASDLF